MKSGPALLVAVLLVLAAPSTVLTQSIDLDGYFDDRLAGSFTGLSNALDLALQSISGIDEQAALSAQVANVSTTINNIILDACSSETLTERANATQQINEEVQKLISFFVAGLPEGGGIELPLDMVGSTFDLGALCPFLSSCGGEECETVVVDEITGATSMPTSLPAADENTPTATGEATPRATSPATTVTLFPGGGEDEGCAGEDCPGYDSDAWACPGNAEAEAELSDACSFTDATKLSAVKAGEAPTSMLFAASAETIANSCTEGCLAAVQPPSVCISPEVAADVMSLCGCHAALDATCQASFRDFLPAAVTMSESSLDLGNPTNMAESPQLQAVASVADPFCTSCLSALMEKGECAQLVPLTSWPCCLADFVNSDCADIMAELPQGPDGGEMNDTALGMAMMPESMIALAQAFSDEDGVAALTSEQRVAVLKEASINRLADLVTVPLTGWCDMIKPDSPVVKMLECSAKTATCFTSMFDGMGPTPGDDEGGMPDEGNNPGDMSEEGMPSIEDLLPAGLGEMCDKLANSCFQTTIDVCLGGSVEDLMVLAEASMGSEDATGEARRLLQDEAEEGGPLSAVSEILMGVIGSAVRQLADVGASNVGENVMDMLSRIMGPMCTSACSTRLATCDAVSVLSAVPLLDSSNPGGLSLLCNFLSVPLFSFGDKQRALKMSATLGLASVEDFTDALRLNFLQKVATAANVPVSQVNITSIKAGSVIVDSVVLVKAETDTAVEAYVADLKAVLGNPTALFGSDALGDVTVQVADTVVVDPNDDCPLCGDGEDGVEEGDSGSVVSAPVTAASLLVVAVAMLMI